MSITFTPIKTDFFTNFTIPQANESSLFVFVKKGQLHISVNKTSFVLYPGTGLIIPRGLNIILRNSNSSGFLIKFNSHPLLDMRYAISVSGKPGYGLINLANKLFDTLQIPTMSNEIPLLSEKLLSLSVPLLEKHFKIFLKTPTLRHTEPTDIAKLFFDNKFKEDITVYDAAQLCGISRTHLHSLFSNRYGISPKQYLLSKRIEEAKKLLETSSETSCQIACSVGFASPQRFYDIFRNFTGMTPSEYRSHMNKPSENR